MKLNLARPLAFFDLETTGTNVVKDRIVEISVIKVQPSGDRDTLTRRVNPEMPIPLEASEIHGIYDFDIKDSPTLAELAPEIKAFMEGCDLAGFNSNRFDIPLLVEEFLRVGVDLELKNRKCVDVQTVFHKMEQRTLSAAYKFYCNKSLDNAHSAEADTLATFEVLEAQLDRYEELENSVEFLHDFSKQGGTFVDFAGRVVMNDQDQPVFNFGKYKNQLVEDILRKDAGYFGWIMNAEFPRYTKKVIQEIREQMLASNA